MEQKAYKRSLASRVGLLYFFMNIISISLFTWVITNNQVELITDNTRYQARELMTSVVQNLRKLPTFPVGVQLPSDQERAKTQADIVAMLKRLVPRFILFSGDQVLTASQPDLALPADHRTNAQKAATLRDHSGVDYHLVLSRESDQLQFYVPLAEFGLPDEMVYVSLSTADIGRRFRDLYQLLAVTVVALTALHAAFALLLFRWVVKPIQRLYQATQKVAMGDFEHKVDFTRSDELGALADSFNYMMDVIQKTFQRIEHMAVTDELTGLSNRRYFFDKSAILVAGAQRYGNSLGMVLIDVDHFKKVNDTYGHQAGDQALKAIARCLTEFRRKPDIVARYGGEELIVLLPETNLEQSSVVAEKIRLAVSNLEIPLDSGQALRLTVSAGIAEFQAMGCPSFQEFVEAVDLALYRAKTAGRNRIEVVPARPS